MSVWAQAADAPPGGTGRLDEARAAWDQAIGEIDEARTKQTGAPGLQESAKKALAARIWTVTATAEMAGLNPVTYLTAYLDACGRNGGQPLPGPKLGRFLPWKATPADLDAWSQPPRPG